MTSDLPVFRALVIYGICLPLAVILGYLLALPLDYTSVGFLGVVLLFLCAPLLLKWHHSLLILAINANAVAFLVPGRPKLWLVLSSMSLGISVLQLTLSRRFRFLHAPSIARPLLFLAVVTVVTAKLTGGIGMQIFGGQNIGGKRYIEVLGAILVYFALAAHRIPPHRALLYGSLFFLAGATNIISSFIHFIAPSFYFIYWLFPPLELPTEMTDATRLTGLAFGSTAAISFLVARYGLRGILLSWKPWRALALLGCVVLSCFGGFRSVLLLIVLLLGIQFYLEGLVKSKLLPVAILSILLGAAVALPFAAQLPRSFQRVLSFLPVEVDPEVRTQAQSSTDWRVKMWEKVLPEVPKHLLLGKGYSMDAVELSRANMGADFQSGVGYTSEGLELAGDYHNGPLSVILPLGIWGLIGFVWLLWAGGRLLYCNHRYGDPALHSINTFLFASFLALTVHFLFVYGSFYLDFIKFTSLLGMSVALNGGVCQPVRAAVAEKRVNIKFREPVKPVPEPFKA